MSYENVDIFYACPSCHKILKVPDYLEIERQMHKLKNCQNCGKEKCPHYTVSKDAACAQWEPPNE